MESKTQQDYIAALSCYIGSLRKIQRITSKVADQIEYIMQQPKEEDESGKTLEKLIGMLQKLSNIIDTIAPLDQKIIASLRELEPQEEADYKINRQDCEIILSVVKNWGLLREEVEIDFDMLIKTFEESRRGNPQ